MKKKPLRILAALVMIVMLASIFGACTSSKDKTTTEATTSAAQAATTTAAEPLKDLSVSLWIPYGQDNPFKEIAGENLVTDWLNAKTGVTIKDVMGNGGQDWEPKLTQMIAGNTMPDTMNSWGNHSAVKKLVEGNQLYELTPEMLEKYAPNAIKRIPQWAWDQVKVNGKLYSIPGLITFNTTKDDIIPVAEQNEYYSNLLDLPNDRNNIYAPIFVRDDILKTLIPTAKTMAELEQMAKDNGKITSDDMIIPEIDSTEKYIKFMYDIKALNLKEGKNPVYATGYPGSDNWYALCSLGAQMSGYNMYYYTTFWDQASKEIKMGYKEPIFANAAKLQSKMLRDKVIDPESLVHSQQQFNEKINNGRYAFYSMGPPPKDVNALLKNEGKTYAYRPFFPNIPQNASYPLYKEPASMSYEFAIFKTVKEEDVGQLLKYVDTCMTEEFEDVYFWGPKEAGLYTENADGTRTFKDVKFQETLVDGKSSLEPEQRKGLGYYTARYFYLSNSGAGIVSKYNPGVINKKNNTDVYTPRFAINSPHVQANKVPEQMAWAGLYSDMDLIINFWKQRDAWDTPFKTALTAKSDEEFDKKWSAAIENMNKVCNMDEMLKQMTERARKQAAELGIN